VKQLVDGQTAGPRVGFVESSREKMRRRAKEFVFGRALPAGSNPRELALTFDDGPNDPYTERLLELLALYRVRAVFFVIGTFVRKRPEIARAIHQAGHGLGNHTMTHPSLLWQKPSRVREELIACNSAIEDAVGVSVKWFRPPFGASRPDVFRTAAELGLTPVLWNVWGHDWDAEGPEPIAALVHEGIRVNQRYQRASNILLHDGGHERMGIDRSATVAATETLLHSWAASGMCPVTLDAWCPPRTPVI
jgi:peptidoglycan/xylan/chitin deacetylase (PgdA/CDA1 family)